MPEPKVGYESDDGLSDWQAAGDPRGWIEGGKRVAVAPGNLTDWWVGVSPRNGYGAIVEGPWDHWVALARGILKADDEWRALAVASEKSETPEEGTR